MRQFRRLHEVTLNAWPPLQQLYYDGWLLGFSRNYTKRANSVHAAFPSSFDVNKKIDRCEELYRERRMRPVFRITPFDSPPDLDRFLRERGYEKQEATTVLQLDLTEFKFPYDPVAAIAVEPLEDWLEAFCKLTGVNRTPRVRQTHLQILQKIPATLCPAVLSYEETAACAMGTLEENFFGISDFIIGEKFQETSCGYRFLIALLTWAKRQDVTKVYTLVPEEDQEVIALFQSQGFNPAYTFWYRMPGTPTVPELEEGEEYIAP